MLRYFLGIGLLVIPILVMGQSHIDMLKNAPIIYGQPCEKEMEFKQSICSFKDVDTVRYAHANTSPVHDFESVKDDIDQAIIETFFMANKIAIEDTVDVDIVIKYEYLDGIGGTLAKALYPSCSENHVQTMTFDNYDLPYGENTPDSIKIYYSDPKDISKITWHEVGHLLGFAHNVEDSESLMYPYYNPKGSWSPDDSLGFYLLFGPSDFISIYKEDFYTIRPNFNISEFFSKCERMNFHMLDKRLIVMAQKLADFYGSSIVINSSYRHRKCNDKAGGAKRSQHLAGRAIDFTFVNRSAHIRFTEDVRAYLSDDNRPEKIRRKNFILTILENGKIGAVGLYNGHIHIDTRKNGDIVIFDKTSALSEDGINEECGL